MYFFCTCFLKRRKAIRKEGEKQVSSCHGRFALLPLFLFPLFFFVGTGEEEKKQPKAKAV